jgi:hypothetical protein
MGPRKPIASPFLISKEILSNARKFPKFFVRFSIRIAAPFEFEDMINIRNKKI